MSQQVSIRDATQGIKYQFHTFVHVFSPQIHSSAQVLFNPTDLGRLATKRSVSMIINPVAIYLQRIIPYDYSEASYQVKSQCA